MCKVRSNLIRKGKPGEALTNRGRPTAQTCDVLGTLVPHTWKGTALIEMFDFSL